MRTRRVGTVTLGITLIFFGILYVARTFTAVIDYTFIIKFWPIVLIFLGIEVLLSCFLNKNGKFVYDFAAIIILILLSCFAIGMAGAEFMIEHGNYYYGNYPLI